MKKVKLYKALKKMLKDYENDNVFNSHPVKGFCYYLHQHPPKGIMDTEVLSFLRHFARTLKSYKLNNSFWFDSNDTKPRIKTIKKAIKFLKKDFSIIDFSIEDRL